MARTAPIVEPSAVLRDGRFETALTRLLNALLRMKGNNEIFPSFLFILRRG